MSESRKPNLTLVGFPVYGQLVPEDAQTRALALQGISREELLRQQGDSMRNMVRAQEEPFPLTPYRDVHTVTPTAARRALERNHEPTAPEPLRSDAPREEVVAHMLAANRRQEWLLSQRRRVELPPETFAAILARTVAESNAMASRRPSQSRYPAPAAPSSATQRAAALVIMYVIAIGAWCLCR